MTESELTNVAARIAAMAKENPGILRDAIALDSIVDARLRKILYQVYGL